MREIFFRSLALAIAFLLPLSACKKPQEPAAQVSDTVDEATDEIMNEEEEEEPAEEEEGEAGEIKEEERPAEDDGEDNTATGDGQ